MKWTEPWRATRPLQGTFNPFGRHQIASMFRWALFFVCLGILVFLEDGTFGLGEIQRLWVSLPLAFLLSTLLYIVHWFARCRVSSGPAGILRHKGEAMYLVPWASIQSWEFATREGNDLLRIHVDSSAGVETIFLPHNVARQAIDDELRRMAVNADRQILNAKETGVRVEFPRDGDETQL